MYPTTLTQLARANPFCAPAFTLQKAEEPRHSPAEQGHSRRRLAAAAVSEGDSCEFGSSKYFVLCGFGGILSCGTTHTAVVPLDLVKCRLQVSSLSHCKKIGFLRCTKSLQLLSIAVSCYHCSRFSGGIALRPGDEVSCEFGSMKYYALCGFGGILSCGITHTAVVPLDLVKCRLQVNPDKYKSIFNGFSVTVREDGMRGLAKGWAPTFIGYSMQGLCKFGFYEVFKIFYSNLLGEENTYMWRTSLYLAASASAEFFADIALAPMEAVKVRIQTQPGYANTLRECVPKMYAEEGLWASRPGICSGSSSFMLSSTPGERPVPRAAAASSLWESSSSGQGAPSNLPAVLDTGRPRAPRSTPVQPGWWADKPDPRSFFGRAVRAFLSRGFAGVWKGLVARIIMIGTLTALQWFIYDSVKVYFRLPRPPPPEMPESLKKKLGLAE
ncbi:MPCP protein, partial [Atractosteus spatula]|nr:MPCP protein [Atractosteus spatula]